MLEGTFLFFVFVFLVSPSGYGHHCLSRSEMGVCYNDCLRRPLLLDLLRKGIEIVAWRRAVAGSSWNLEGLFGCDPVSPVSGNYF
ncbi:hypothetical protein V8F06_002706 [Rhypophila decipiens]